MQRPVRTLALLGAAGYPAAWFMMVAALAVLPALGVDLPPIDTPVAVEWFVAMAAWGALSVSAPAMAIHHPVRSPLLLGFGALGFVAALGVALATGTPPTTSDVLAGSVAAGLVVGLSYPRVAPVVGAASAGGPLVAIGLGSLLPADGDGTGLVMLIVGLVTWGALVGGALGLGERCRLQDSG